MSFSVLSAVLLLLLCLFSPISSQSDCSEPSQSDLAPFITEFLLDSDGSMSYSPTIIGSVHYVCQAQGSSRGTYRSLSIIATFTPNPGESQTTRIFQIRCSSGSWEADLNGGIPAPVSGLISAPTRTDCVLCNHVFGSDRCRACDSSCNTGLGRCVGSQTICCPYFSPTDQCTIQCPINFNASASNGFICTCNMSCEAGYTLNTTTCSCSLSNICELSPCQNGGSCTLVSAPSNYTCDCTGTGYQGINCSISISLPITDFSLPITDFSLNPIADSPPPIADWSTASSTHVVGILPMLTTQFISLVITTPETETVNFTVSSLTQTIGNGSVTAGTPITISDSTLLSYHVNSESERYKGLLVTTGTDKKISVAIAMSHFGDYSAGVYVNYPALVYPVNSYVYYAVSIGTDESTSYSSLLIVSGNNNTNITITPTVTVTIPSNLTQSGDEVNLNAGQSITIQLQYLETLLLKPVAARADLTGTKVESNNPISVYSGHTCGFIPVGQFACDFVGEQIPPVASWGNEFLVQSFYNRESGYILKLIGSQNNTGIDMTCNNGNSYSLSLQENGVLSPTIPQTSCYINSTSPILVAQFSLAQFADSSFSSYGDPAMSIIPPLHQYPSNVTSFPVISLLNAPVSVNLVVLAADDSSQIRLNGALLPSLTSSSWKHYNSSVGGGYVFNSYSLSGSGEVSIWSDNSNDKILAMVYGLQQFVGYSYTGNLELKPSESCFLLCQANYILDTATCACVLSNSQCQGINCTELNYTAPNISAPVSYVAVLNGSSVTLRCVLHHVGNPNATIQWTFTGSVITNNSLFLITEDSTRLDITNITASYSGAYHCNASNVAGASVATINVDVQEPPYFTVTPYYLRLLIYNNITTLNCSSSGVPLPNITWFKDGIVIPTDQYTSSNQSDTLITMLTVVGSLTSGGNYTCQAVNDLVERRVINTTVNVITFSYPLISNVTLNQSDTFTAHCSSSGILLPAINWVFVENNTITLNLSNSSRVSITTDIQSNSIASTLTIKNVDKATDEGGYLCYDLFLYQKYGIYDYKILNIVCNNSCEAGYTLHTTTCACSLSNICELSPCQNGGSCTLVSAPSSYTCDCTGTGYQGINCTDFLGIPPIITAPQLNFTALNGSSATMTCSLQHVGTPVATITWRFNGNTLSSSLKYSISDTAGSTQLVINDVVLSDAGIYYCEASNGGGLSTAGITLNVQVPPSIIFISNETQVRYKTNVTLLCVATGVPRPVITWSKDGVNEQNLNIPIILSDYGLLSYFSIEGSLTSTGQYTCTAANDLVERRVVSMSVNVLTYEPLQFNKGVIGNYSIQSEPYTAYCNFTALPLANVIWARDGIVLYSNTELSITTDIAGITLSSKLTIRNLNKKRDEGNYTCTATSLQYSHTFAGKLQVEVPAVVRPDSSRFSTVINATSYISFSITNQNDLIRNYTIQWHFKRRGTDTYTSLNSEIFHTSRLSDDGLQLMFSSAQLQHRGTYRITVSNPAADVTATANFDVFVPAELRYTAGVNIVKERQQNVSFNCSADGIPMPTIVWRKDGQLLIQTSKRSITEQGSTGFRSNVIPGVLQINSTLTITGLTGSDNGSYSCRADNEANIGTVLMEPFILSVVEPPPPNYCLPSSPCLNGECHSLFDGYYCACPETHTGINCEEAVVVTIPPVITEPPRTTTEKLYSSTSLTCRATGSPTPSILWYKDNRLIPNTNPDSSVLFFNELSLSDRGFYHCVAVNVIDGKNVSVNSPTVLLNITNVVQYEAEMVLPPDFYDNLNDTESEDAIRQLIIDSNNYLSGSNISDTSFFFIEILDIDEDNPEPNSIPVVVTLVTERGQGDQMLLTGVRGQLDSLRQQLRVEISVATVSRFDGCLSNSTTIPSPSGDPDLSLTVNWPETNIGVLAIVDCPCGANGTSGGGALQATRYCGGDFTDGAMWLTPDVVKCNFSDLARRICRLSDLPVSDKVEELETLTSNSSMLGSTEVAASVSVLVTATDELAGNLTLTMTFLEVVDNIIDVNQEVLQESQESSNTSARILEAIDSVVDNIPIANASEPVVIAQKSFAVSVQEVDPEMFSRSGQTFSINIANFAQQNISSGDLSFENNAVSPPTGSIQLPSNLFSSLPENVSRISHAVFVTDSLFLRRAFSYQRVSSVIISASVVGAGTIRNLRPPVNLGFQLNPNVNGSLPQCTFWNQSLDDGYGDWSSDGCNTSSGSPDSQVTCNCDHLTNFAILLDVSPPEEPTERTVLTLFLDSVSYIGIIVSIICLIITIISYLLSKKLRSSDHGQLLLNLCFALMGLYLSFIVALHSKNTNGFCAFSGAVLQYFFLVTFAIMAAEAINLYINLVIVLGRKIQSFSLKVTIVSWVAPVFVVLLCFSPDYRNYISSPPNFCRAFKAPFYIGVVVPFSIIYIFNWIVFVIIIVSLLRKNFSSKLKELKKAKKDKSKSFFRQQLIIAVTLSILFGLGWGLGLLVTQEIYTSKTVRDLFAALFVILTAFHGFFIFIMHCLRSKDVRSVWKRAFFGVTGRDFTEFSSSTFNRVRGKSSGGTSTAMRSPHRKVSSEKSPSFSFSDGKSFFKRGGTMQEYAKKKEAEAEEEIKELEEKGVKAVDNDYVAIEDTAFDFEKDGQGTLRFYAKKDRDHETQFDSLNDRKNAKEDKNEEGPPSKEETGLEICVNVPSEEIKEEEPKVAKAIPVKSFPDDDEDEKGRLREEEDRAYNAYHSNA